jgi:hypothetical protein
MSVRSVILECTKCQASYSRGVLYGNFRYELPNGDRHSLDRSLGWCNHCATMVAIENLSCTSSASEVEKITRLKAEAELKLRSVFGRIVGKHRATVRSCDQKLEEIEKRVSFLRQRTAPPKCLECGSADIFQLPWPPWPEDPGQPVSAGWRHPTCGGEMVARALGGRLYFSYPPRIYDANGLALSSEASATPLPQDASSRQ